MAAHHSDVDSLLETARSGINGHLDAALRAGRIDQQLYDQATQHTLPALTKWLTDSSIAAISPHIAEGIRSAIERRDWNALVNAFRQSVRFGTGGIRGMMAFDRDSIVRLKEEGLDAPILKGPNTINEIVVLLTSVGVARFGKDRKPAFGKIVIGYDSRIRGHDLAAIVAQLFLAYGYTVYFFDAPCPYPEVTFAIPHELVKADVGILISASHNDYRYNGYKLSCANGSQFDPEERDLMYNRYIAKAEPGEIRLCPFRSAPDDKLWFLGGSEPEPAFDYAGRPHRRIDIHSAHREHVKRFLLTPDLADKQRAAAAPLRIGYCAFHGAGRVAVPRLLRDVGFTSVLPITVDGLNDLDGLFPSFCSTAGREQQPDPGDSRAADIAVSAFKRQYAGEFDRTDLLIGTDPDADRCGVVVKVPARQQRVYAGRDYTLLPADELWALLLWYRLMRESEAHGRVLDADKKFIVLSHTTSDSIARLACKHGIGVVKTWVGFASLAASTRDVWEQKAHAFVGLREGRASPDFVELCHPFVHSSEGMENGVRSINIGAFEQSNGISILGGPPPDGRSLGRDGHVRDKDGTLAALLMAEVAAWAKDRGSSLLEALDEHVYSDPEIGLFVNLYEPDPLDGEYPGIEGDRHKKSILRRSLGYFQLAVAEDLEIGGLPVTGACIYRTGKYDAIYPPSHDFQFPDEGVRFYFDEARLSHVTVRPSGTGNSLRFHIQLYEPHQGGDLIARKESLRARGRAIMDDLRRLLKAPRV